MSARDCFLISLSGRSIQDNTWQRNPSILVSELIGNYIRPKLWWFWRRIMRWRQNDASRPLFEYAWFVRASITSRLSCLLFVLMIKKMRWTNFTLINVYDSLMMTNGCRLYWSANVEKKNREVSTRSTELEQSRLTWRLTSCHVFIAHPARNSFYSAPF